MNRLITKDIENQLQSLANVKPENRITNLLNMIVEKTALNTQGQHYCSLQDSVISSNFIQESNDWQPQEGNAVYNTLY